MVHKNRTMTLLGRRHSPPSLGMDGVCVLTLLFAVLFSTPADAGGLTASNLSVVFYRQGENGHYGNNVTLRPTFLASDANKSWFDYETILPGGALRKVFFMACNYSQMDDTSAGIRLQIWRPVNLSVPSLRLVWQQRVQLPTKTNVPMMYTYSINATVALVSGDRMGWEFEGTTGPICFEYTETHRTFFYRTTGVHPEVGQLAMFDPTFLPSQFSMAVSVDGKATGDPNDLHPSQASRFELWGLSLIFAVSLSVAFFISD